MANRSDILNVLDKFWDSDLSSAVVREQIATGILQVVTGKEESGYTSTVPEPEPETLGAFEKEIRALDDDSVDEGGDDKVDVKQKPKSKPVKKAPKVKSNKRLFSNKQ